MWITAGEKPAVYGLKRPELQALLADVALAPDETTLQLNTFTGFRVVTYMAEGDNYRLAANMFLPEQMEIMVEVMLAVVGNGVTSEDGVDRISMLEDGLREGSLPQAPGQSLPAGEQSPAVFADRQGYEGVRPATVFRGGVRRESGARRSRTCPPL